MRKFQLAALIVSCLLCFTSNTHAQIIKKPKINLKKGGKNLLDNMGKQDEPVEETITPERREESGGKKLKPPDVNKNIDDAVNAFDRKSYGDSRFAIEQALMGVELEIGHQILESMPESLKGIHYEESEDEVASSGYGFAGLVVRRKYYGDDSSVEVSVLNNAMAISNIHLMVSNPSMASYDENEKIITVQENRALLEYDEYSGFKLTVPLGQSTGFMLHCINFESEDEVIETADLFDLAEIMNLLGEK